MTLVVSKTLIFFLGIILGLVLAVVAAGIGILWADHKRR